MTLECSTEIKLLITVKTIIADLSNYQKLIVVFVQGVPSGPATWQFKLAAMPLAFAVNFHATVGKTFCSESFNEAIEGSLCLAAVVLRGIRE